MTRADLQRLTAIRLREAKLLFRAGEYSGAYYLAAYSVECALKACFAKGVKRFDFPDKIRTQKIYTHDLRELVKFADLQQELDKEAELKPNFRSGWTEVCKWSEEKRYSVSTREEADAILDAIIRRKDGVLPWIRRHW